MNQSSSTTSQQTLTSMLMEAVKAASSNKQSTSEQSSNNNPCNTTSNNNNCIDNLSMIGSANNANNCVINNNGVVVDQNLVMQMMRMMLSNDPLFNQQQTIVNSTSTTNLSQVNTITQNTNQTINDNLDSSQMLTMLMNNSMNNTTMSQLNHLFSNFLLGNTTTNTGQEQSTIINTSANISDKKMSYISMSPTFDQLIHSPQFFDNGCSTHIFIKKGNTKRKNSKEEQNWYRLLVQHQTSPNTNITQEDSTLKRMTNCHTKIVHTNKCLISTDCFYYLLVVLPSKMYSLSDLEFQLEEDNAEGKKKKRPSSSNVSTPPFEIKLRGKDITTSTKLKQQSIQSPNSSNDISNLIAVFEIMINRKRAKTKSESTFNIHLTCKQEKLIKMSLDLNEIGKQNESDEILDLAEDVNVSVKKRKKESPLIDQDEEESDNPLDSTTDSARKRTKSNIIKESTFDLLKQWIIVTVFHDSLNVDMTKFPNFAFPKELFLNETFLLYVDVPTQLSEYHDICFKILDAESKQELSFNGEKWIDTNVINCCNFNIQASLVSLHVEYSISFRDINHDKPLVFVVALKDKNTEEERVIYNGSPFKIQKQAESIDELGISTIHYSGFSGFESLTEPTIISEIFDEIPILNGESLFSEVASPTLSANFVPASESEDIMDDFERFLDM